MKLTDSNFQVLRDFIYNFCGIYFQTGRKYFLESRLARRMEVRGLKDYTDCHKLLRNGAEGPAEIKQLLIEITTNETFFFRNTQQIAALERQFLPELVETKKKIGFKSCGSGATAPPREKRHTPLP